MNSLAKSLMSFFASIIVVVLLLTGWLLSRAVEAHFVEMDRAILQNMSSVAINRLVDYLNAAGDQLDEEKIQNLLTASLEGAMPSALVLKSPQQELWISEQRLTLPKELITYRWQYGVQKYRKDALCLRILYQEVRLRNQMWQITAIQDIQHHAFFMTEFYQMLVVSLLLALFVAMLLSYVLIQRTLQPLTDLAQSMRLVSVHDLLKQRLSLPNAAELRQLAEAYNAMLNRLSGAFHRLKDFSADLAHELRSPLNALLLQTEVTLSKARTVDEYEAQLDTAYRDLSRLSKTVDEMLFLAKADKGLMFLERHPVMMHALFDGLVDYFSPLVEEKNQHLTLLGDAVLLIDQALIQRAFANLLNNAIEYAPEGDEITIEIRSTGTFQAWITIENSAPEMQASQLDRLFDRFWRQDPARSQDNHLGLGLAIVKSIIELHDGQITAQLHEGRLSVRCYW